MTEPSRSNADPSETVGDALRGRQDRWRAGTHAAPRPASRRVATGAALAVAALAALSLSTVLVVAPLFSWQTAGVALIVDEYSLDMLPTVPFAHEDTTALATSLTGRLAPSLAGELVQLKGFETVEAMRDRLHGFCVDMPLRGKDSMIAYVRGQCLVPPPVLDADGNERPDPLGGHACLVAADATLRGEGLRELVPCREIVESIGSAASLTTLVAIDLGNLRWDPRIGVLCSLVPRQLDRDFKAPPVRANGQNWVIASHDTLQYSGASDTAKRTFFAAALEQGLAGAADEPPWGDGDRVVELHELAQFVVAWTSEWSRLATGGRAMQRPAVWKLGVGRVALGDIPRNIRLVRVAPTPGSGVLAALRRLIPGSAPAKPTTPTPAAAAAAAPPAAAAPAAAPAPAIPPGVTAPAETAAAAALTAAVPTAVASAAAAAGDAARSAAAVADSVAPPLRQATAGATPATEQPGAATAAGAAGAADPQPTAAVPQPPAPGADPQVPATPSGPQPASPAPTPARAAAAPTTRSDDPWDLLQSVTSRTGPPPVSPSRPSVIDFAPHLWRQAASFVAAATTDAGIGGPGAERARAALQRFKAAMSRIDDTSPTGFSAEAGSPQAEALAGARRAANAAGIQEAWSTAPRPFQVAIAARNDAVELGWAMLDVIGRLSGGAGPQFIAPGLIDGFIARISRLSNAIAQAPSMPPPDKDTARLDPLTIATQNMLAQSSLLRTLQDQLLTSLTAEAGSAARIPLHDRMILLRSRLPDAAQRAKLLPPTPAAAADEKQAGGSPADAALVLKAEGRPPLPSGPPRSIDRAAWKNCASLAEAVVDLVDAAGLNVAAGQNRGPTLLQPTLDDIAAARRAIAALDNAAGEDEAASEAAAKLSYRLARLFERAAVAAARANDTAKGPANVVESDRLGGLLRMIDPRDAAVVGDRMIAGLTRWNAASRYGLRVQRPDPTPPRLGVATDIQISVADAARVPATAALTLGFDPAQLVVRLPDGTGLVDGVSISSHDLPWRGGAFTLHVVPLRRAALGDKRNATQLSAVLTADEYVENAYLSVPLPSERGVLAAARGRAGSIAGMVGEDGWVRASRAPVSARPPAIDEAATSLLSLTGQSARVTSWELGLDNLSGEARTFDVELHSIPGTSSPRDRERAWSDATTALLAGRSLGTPLARASGVALGVNGQIVPLVLKPDNGGQADQKKAAEPDPLPAAAANSGALELPPPRPAGAAGREVGPDLALVVRDAKAPAGAQPTITRIILDALHPRQMIVATARYDSRARTIGVSLGPVGGNAALLPPDGTRVTLREAVGEPATGGPQASVIRPVVPRKPGAVLTAAAPTDDVVASWNGPDQGTARFSLDVDGYPRAFNFAVDCSSATDMQPQGPQYDWRQIHILAPAARTTLLEAPVASVPMRLAIDAPADTFLAGESVGGSVAIVLRQIGAGLSDRGEERTVWTAAHDRQVTFTLEPSPAGASLAIKTVVDDWTVAASGEGFSNVDVSAEARLEIAGEQSPIIDSRVLVFDGQAPVVDVPPAIRATVGRPVVVPIQASDDSSDGYLIPPERRRPGVSGLKSVEWAIDFEGKGAPKEWQPAAWIGGTNYEVRIDSAKLPLGVRLPVLVRATDAVGLSDPPARIWLDVASEQASKLNSLTGKVVLSGRGEPNLPVVLSGPGGERTARTRQDGGFRFDDLEPGEYKASVQAPVRNQIRKAEPTPVTVEAAPAPPASVTLELK
jgi:hypothetical protein